MKSIDELRKFYEKANGYEMWTPKHKAELDSIADRIETELAERYIALPLDAEGEPIHVGDVLMAGEYGGKVITCTGYCYQTEGYDEPHWSIAFEYDGRSGTTEFSSARHCRHHRPPTVEDVLEDMIAEAADCDTAELVERYSKLLALRGE